jgi:hypothetical protein
MISRATRLSKRRPVARRGFFAALRSQHGIIDLGSILVGVVVTAIVTGAAAASVMVIVPWSEDNAASSAISIVRNAEAGTSARTGQYATMSDLISQGRILRQPSLTAVVGQAGSCYVIASLSSSGTVFYATSRDSSIVSNKSGPVDTSWCAPAPIFSTDASSLGRLASSTRGGAHA